MRKGIKIGITLLLLLAVVGISCAAAVYLAGRYRPAAQEEISDSATEAALPEDYYDVLYQSTERNPEFHEWYKDLLVEDEIVVYDALRKHFIEEKRNDELVCVLPSGRVYKNAHTTDEIARTAYDVFMLDYPEVYWVDYRYCTVRRNEDNLIDTIIVRFASKEPDRYDDAGVILDNIAAAVEKVKETRASESRYDTVKAIHDYVCLNVKYDWGIVNRDYLIDYTYLAAPLFGGSQRGSRFVCSGYAESFRVLCNRFGIPCLKLDGNWKIGPHSWSYVQMDDGKWYGADVTWDDNERNPPRYTYFLTGNNTLGDDRKTFAEMHQPDPGVYLLADEQLITIPFPTLADERYESVG